MKTNFIDYSIGGVNCRGYLAQNGAIKTKQPAILIAHAWQGQDDFARDKADSLAKMGYIAFAADLYGNGIYADSREEAAKLMMPLFLDRRLLQERIIAALETLKTIPQVDIENVGAIGFCFGGLTVLELLRSGAKIKGVVSFHGVLGDKMGDAQAKTVPIAEKIDGSALILHGHDDPLVSKTDIEKIQNELTLAHVDWQMHIYGRTKHAFTNPLADDDSMGLIFNNKASVRAWKSMENFFSELFLFH